MKINNKKESNRNLLKNIFLIPFRRQYIFIWLFVIIYIAFAISSPAYRTLANLLDILRISAIGSLLFMGLTWVIAAGEIDLSFPEVAAFTCVVIAYLFQKGINIGLAVLISFLLGILFGFLNGILVGYVKIPSLITTIASGAAAKALANILAKGQPIYVDSGSIINKLVFGYIFKLPILFLIVLAIYIFMKYIQDSTTIGQYIYAIGENRKASKAAGINEKKIILGVYVLAAFMASLAGIFLTGLLSSGQPEIGYSYLLDGLLAVFLGALVIKEGKPNVIGTIIAVIILGILVNGFTLLGIPYYMAEIVKGSLLISGVSIMFIIKNSQRVLVKK